MLGKTINKDKLRLRENYDFMKTNSIIFNDKIYAFESDILNKFFDRMLFNATKDEDEKKCIISFITDRFGMKSYEDLDYHEFLIDGNFRVSQILCNIANVYGERIKEKYKREVSLYLQDEIDDTDWFDTLSVNDAIEVAKQVFENDDSELLKFKDLLSTMYLYECARFDYEQTITDSEDFNDLEFVNGIGIKKIVNDGMIILKPIHSIHDSARDKYIKIKHVLVAPKVLASVFKTVTDNYQDLKGVLTVQNFFKKFEQLTGCSNLKNAPEPPISFIGDIKQDLVGKWYHITKSNGFVSMYHINIDWFKTDGSLVKSVVFVQRIGEYRDYENWGPKESKWLANDSEILINDAYSKKEVVKPFQLNGDILTIGDTTYYRSYDEAAKNVEIDSPF